MNKIKHLLIITSCFLLSCNNQAKETCTLHINNHSCTYEGLKDSYMVGDTATITFKVNDLFNLPKEDDIKIYGSQDYTYDETTGVLNVKLDSNTGIDITAIPQIGGRESTFGEVRKFAYDHLPPDPKEEDIPFNKVKIKWNFSTLDESQGYDAQIIKVILSGMLGIDDPDAFTYNLKGDEVVTDVDKTELSGIYGYFYLETAIYNGRIIVDTLKDIFTINEESKIAECLIHDAHAVKTKDIAIHSPVIFTIDEHDMITHVRLYLEENKVFYKNFDLHTPGYIDAYYFTEVA